MKLKKFWTIGGAHAGSAPLMAHSHCMEPGPGQGQGMEREWGVLFILQRDQKILCHLVYMS